MFIRGFEFEFDFLIYIFSYGRLKRWSRRPHNGVISGSKTFGENVIDFNGGDMRRPC